MRPPVLAAIALLLAAAPAAAAPRLVGLPAHVRGGAELHVRWTGLGPEADEAELELSLAGGRWVRISPELDAREGSFTWRVPSGLTGPARLRLRHGGEGFEADGDVSAPFVLESDLATSRAPDASAGDGWSLGRMPASLPGAHVAGSPSLPSPTGWPVAPCRSRDAHPCVHRSSRVATACRNAEAGRGRTPSGSET